MNLRVRRIGLGSAAKFGFVTGAVTAIPVGIIVAFIVRFSVSHLRHLLEGWQHISIDLGLLGKTQIDLIPLLKLGDTLAMLKRIDELPMLLVVVVFVVVILIAGMVSAVFTSWQALAYNSMATLSGGLMVELEPEGNSKMIVVRGARKT